MTVVGMRRKIMPKNYKKKCTKCVASTVAGRHCNFIIKAIRLAERRRNIMKYHEKCHDGHQNAAKHGDEVASRGMCVCICLKQGGRGESVGFYWRRSRTRWRYCWTGWWGGTSAWCTAWKSSSASCTAPPSPSSFLRSASPHPFPTEFDGACVQICWG